jgi:SAM-dependent methyltransferase
LKKFGKFGNPERKDAQCLFCGSMERHRLVWLYFEKMTDLFDGSSKSMLHVAPEPFFEATLKKQLGTGYISADIQNNRAMVKMDVTDIQFPNGNFDVIYCSHVLEHVLDDKRAMREFYRVLKVGGWAIILVPIFLGKLETLEDPAVTDPAERTRLFGQEDHVRWYGQDYLERLREAGFTVNVVKPADFLAGDEIERMGITSSAGEIYYCAKPKRKET